jgi:hypothetical protein
MSVTTVLGGELVVINDFRLRQGLEFAAKVLSTGSC